MVIVGAKGFAVQLHDILYRLGETSKLVFFDDISNDLPMKFLDYYPILRNKQELLSHFEISGDKRFVLGTGGTTIRRELFDKFIGLGASPHTIISKDCIIGSFQTKIGEGTCILSNSVIESTVEVGRGSLINLNVLLTHHSILGDFCELSPGVRISGRCKIGNNVFLGTGAIVLPKVNIGDNSIIGAGAVVTRDVKPNTKVIGLPARPI